MKLFVLLLVSFLLLLNCNNKKRNTIIKHQKKIERIQVLQHDTLFNFELQTSKAVPLHWSQFYTGKGKNPDWKIIDNNGNKVLAQLSDKQPNYHFNEIIYDNFKLKNMILEVKMKGVSGQKDQGGGLVWRFIDKDNYYVVRANPLEDNMVLYKVKNGNRTDLPLLGKGRTYGITTKPLGKDWNTLKLIVKKDIFTVFLNGDELFQVQDKTFSEAGKIGLWTKADAVTYFDDFFIKPLE